MENNTNPIMDMINSIAILPCLECGKDLTFKPDVKFFDVLEHHCNGFDYEDKTDNDILTKINDWNTLNIMSSRRK